MNTPRSNRLTRRAASQALDGHGSTGSPGLDRVLTAASAPAAPTELGRESAMVAIFQGAQLGSVPTAGRPTMLKSTLTRLAAAKLVAAAAGAAVVATGGLALAAATGNLPDPLSHSEHAGTGAAHATAAPTSHPTADATEPAEVSSETPSATPTPSFTGLCHAYQAGATSHAVQVLANPAFSALAQQAGGADNIAAYCTALIGAPRTHPTGAPSGHPTGRPTGVPSSHPSGPPAGVPTSHPTGAPVPHPSGPPAGVPPTHPGAP